MTSSSQEKIETLTLVPTVADLMGFITCNKCTGLCNGQGFMVCKDCGLLYCQSCVSTSGDRPLKCRCLGDLSFPSSYVKRVLAKYKSTCSYFREYVSLLSYDMHYRSCTNDFIASVVNCKL